MTDLNIQTFVSGKRIALAGASRSGKKFGNMAAKELKQRGYQVFLIHPQAAEIEGERCYPDLAAVRDQVDGLMICLPPKQVEPLLRQAAALDLRNVWLQQGAETGELVALGCELGLNVVSGKCLLMYAEPVRSFHKFHRVVNKIFGQL